MPIRVAQIGTGNVGAHALRSVIANPAICQVAHRHPPPQPLFQHLHHLLRRHHHHYLLRHHHHYLLWHLHDYLFRHRRHCSHSGGSSSGMTASSCSTDVMGVTDVTGGPLPSRGRWRRLSSA